MKDLISEKQNLFQRSVNIVSDIDNLEILNSFLPSITGNNTLLEFCANLTKGQGAFTWTGAYGSGKSTLAVILLSLLRQKKSQIYKTAINTVSDDVLVAIDKCFAKFSNRTLIPLVGPKGNLDQILRAKLKDAFPDADLNGNLVDVFERITKAQQIFLVIDELGKYLEDAARNNNDIFILQELAELASRSGGNFILLGILHQSFSEYTQNFDKQVRDEWQKIQGRFLDIPINITLGEQISLISAALDESETNWSQNDPYLFISNVIDEIKGRERWVDHDTLLRMYPLNPISAMLIASISKKSFSQNQRTLFSFLNSFESLGYQRYLQEMVSIENANYSPDLLWDYLSLNFENQIINSPDGQSWLIARDCLSRLEATQHSSLEIKCLKTLGALQIFGDSVLLKTNIETIQASIVFENVKLLNEAMEGLAKKKIVFYKEVTQTFHLSEATDFDLEEEIKPFQIKTLPDTSVLQTLLKLRPIVGKRHYIETGNLRWLDISLIPLEELLKKQETFLTPTLYIVLGDKNDKRQANSSKIKSIIKGAEYPVVVAYPKHSEILGKNILRLFSLRQLKRENTVITYDKVARRIVDEEISYLESSIEADIEKSLSFSDWHFSRANNRLATKVVSIPTLNTSISELFDLYFNLSPRIKNELANKSVPSPVANMAMKALMLKCYHEEGKRDLDLDLTKMPPEKTIYNAVIKNFGLYTAAIIDQPLIERMVKYKFLEPKKNEKSGALYEMWRVAFDFLKEKKECNITDIIDLWMKPPFGIKAGISPLLVFLFFINKRKELYLYQDGLFLTDINEITIDFIIKHPSKFSFKFVDYNQAEETYRWIALAVSTQLNKPVKAKPLEIGQALVTFLRYDCAGFTSSTKKLSAKSLKLRNDINSATDPIDLIDNKISKDFDQKSLKKALDEINNVYWLQIKTFQKTFIKELGLRKEKNPASVIRTRAASILGKTGNLVLEPFLRNISVLDDDFLNFEGVLQIALKKPPKDMIDLDLDKGQTDLKYLIYEFKKAELFVKVDGRKRQSANLSIIYGTKDTETTQREFSLSKEEQKEVNSLLSELLSWKKEGVSDEVIVGTLAKYLERTKNDTT